MGICKKLLTAAACLAFVMTGVLSAEDGVTGSEIKLGQSCALEGPASALGTGMKAGLLAAFGEKNDAGGVNGRKISLKSLDDGYEPAKAISNVTQFIEKDKVFCLIGEVGTPTSKAVVPMTEKAKVPFFGPFTGAGFLRDPEKMIINVRGSYDQEMERLAQYLVDKKGLKKIACLYQNDGYGQVGLSGITKALKKRGLELCATGTYERNTVAVKSGVLKVRKGKPDAVVMVGAYKPCAAFIKLAKKTGMKKTVYCNISFVGTAALTKELGAAGEDCIISQVVVYPWDTSIPLVKSYQAAMKKYQPGAKVGFVSLEGYMVGKLFCMAAEKAGKNLTRAGLIKAVEDTGTFDLGGVELKYGADDHQGMDKVFLTIIKGGKIQELKD
ncbi:MAG: ABC transporter substrate-binding protein [Planctomycetota bacterium]|jgi:ABC-type branched-subunit amino acid transport system substrate-binding protein